MATTGIMNITLGLLIIAISLPLLKRKIPMNRWYEVRIRQSFTSEENWYRINEYGAQRLILWSLAIIFLGVMQLAPPFRHLQMLQVIFSLAPLLVLIPAIESYLFARTLG